MSRKRFVIEGEWSGYTSAQRRVVHRHVTTKEALVEWVRKTYGIRYTDNTVLALTVRPCRPHERVKENASYKSLIEDCFYAGVSSVDALCKRRKEMEAR